MILLIWQIFLWVGWDFFSPALRTAFGRLRAPPKPGFPKREDIHVFRLPPRQTPGKFFTLTHASHGSLNFPQKPLAFAPSNP